MMRIIFLLFTRLLGWLGLLLGAGLTSVGFDYYQIEKVAAFCGLQLTKVPRVKDIEHEVVI